MSPKSPKELSHEELSRIVQSIQEFFWLDELSIWDTDEEVNGGDCVDFVGGLLMDAGLGPVDNAEDFIRLKNLVSELHLVEEALDEAVFNCAVRILKDDKAAWEYATQINDEGFEKQLLFLLMHNSAETVEAFIRAAPKEEE